jgi:chitodextrinase
VTPTIESVEMVVEGLDVTFTATVSGTEPLSYLWTFGDGVTSTLPVVTHHYDDYGTYTVGLTVTNPCGGDGWVDELVLPRPPITIYLPVVTRTDSGRR